MSFVPDANVDETIDQSETKSHIIKGENTLDPNSPEEWAALRALGHRMLDDLLDHMRDIGKSPAWKEMPPEGRVRVETEGVPREPQDVKAVYESFLDGILPYSAGNAHPRFFGWVQSNGTPLGMLADMLASGMNPHMAGFNQAPAVVEEVCIQWLAELMGFPPASSGLLTSGGTMANLIGLTVGRHAKAGYNVRAKGVMGGPLLRVYTSGETHNWVKKALDLMGMGQASLVPVPVDAGFRMDLRGLEMAIRMDREAGYRPLCVIGTAGTVNTGAIDDLEGIAEVCRVEDLWFHVDGAFGAMAYWSESLRSALKGMEKADSLAFDLHKWGYLPFEVGCVLVRDAEAHTAAFATPASYLTTMERGPAVGRMKFADRGIELTRGFKALKVWMSLKTHGTNAIAAMIEQNVAQMRYLAELVEASEELELAAEVSLNIVCFRYKGATDAENTEILLRIQERGLAVPSSTVLEGRFAIRAANVNHRTRREDIEALVDAVERVGREVLGERRNG